MPALAGVKAKLRAALYDTSAAQRVAEKIAPIPLNIDASHPVRVNLLLPEINFRTFFGGYIAKFHLAQKLADAGLRVRLVLVDACVPDEAGWRRMVSQYAGLGNVFDRVEVAFCHDRGAALPVSPNDRLIATTWWTAHIANAMARSLGLDKFVYLIQEYEAFTFPMGSYYALAAESYTFPHRALFSSPQLEAFFRQQGIGVFGEPWGQAAEAMPFENAILAFDESELFQRRVPDRYRLLFYARPEAHAARNMFEIAFLALSRAIEAGYFEGAEWTFHGIGSSQGDMALPRGHTLKMLGKFGLDEYRQRLLDYDVGLSLMYTPHPSLLPLEMAAAGMWVVTNACENKTQAELSEISANLLAPAATIEGVTEALAQAARDAGDFDARQRGSAVNWASNWEQSFSPGLMERVLAWLA